MRTQILLELDAEMDKQKATDLIIQFHEKLLGINNLYNKSVDRKETSGCTYLQYQNTHDRSILLTFCHSNHLRATTHKRLKKQNNRRQLQIYDE